MFSLLLVSRFTEKSTEWAAPAAHNITKRHASQKKSSPENKILAHSNTEVSEHCEIPCPAVRIAIESYKETKGWKPLVLTLGKIELFLWVDREGRVRERKEDERLHHPPLFIVDFAKRRLRFEGHGFPFDIYERNPVRTRLRLLEKNIPVHLEILRINHKIHLYIGESRLRLNRLSGGIKQIGPGIKELRLNGLPVHAHIRLGSPQKAVIDDGPAGSRHNRDDVPRLTRAITAEERSALIDLYKSTNGDNWTNNSGWKSRPLESDGFARRGTENSWYGISCNDANSRVEKIALPNNNLVGELPAGIWYLSDVQYLDLSNNSISGAIPATLRKLKDLGSLFLSANQFTGQIPADLGSLGKLVNLFLDSNQLTGRIPAALGNLTNLRSLRLDSNRLSGSIPSGLGSIRGLLYLHLSHNQLQDEIPWQLGNLHRLVSLLLSSNRLKGEIPHEIGDLSNLVYLCLDSNDLEGGIPPEIENLENLALLQLQDNRLKDTLPAELGHLVNLEYLYINSNKIWEAIPASLRNLTRLKDLDIGYNALFTFGTKLKDFLDGKDPDWADTQTAAPLNLRAYPLSNTAMLLTWMPIAYTGDAGHYKAYSAQKSGYYPVAAGGTTKDKHASQLTIAGLKRNTTYYFVAKTRTEPHEYNKNTVISQIGAEVSAKTKNANNVKISGIIKNPEGKVVPGVTLTFSNFGGSCGSGGSGNYSHEVVYGWSGIAKPAKSGYVFSPASRAYANVTSEKVEQDYTAVYGMIHVFSVQRRQEQAWFIKRDYADIHLTIHYPEYADRFIIYRKEREKPYQLVREFFPADLEQGNYSYTDTFIDKDISYTYMLAALNSAKTVIAVSDEKKI